VKICSKRPFGVPAAAVQTVPLRNGFGLPGVLFWSEEAKTTEPCVKFLREARFRAKFEFGAPYFTQPTVAECTTRHTLRISVGDAVFCRQELL
jgi:hypothetical protein